MEILRSMTGADNPGQGWAVFGVQEVVDAVLGKDPHVFRQRQSRRPRFGRIGRAAGPVDLDFRLGQSLELLVEEDGSPRPGQFGVDNIAGQDYEGDPFRQCGVEHSPSGGVRRFQQRISK